MAEGVPKKSKKRRHSQIDNDEELLTKSPRLAQSKVRAKHVLPEIEDQSPPASEPDGVPATKDTRAIRKFKFPKRPVNKSWITHISAVIICKLVDDAVKKKMDPRQDLGASVTDGFSLSREEVKKLWYYIGKEYPSSFTLNDVLTELAPLHKVTPTDIMNQEVLLKYKDQIPKPPVTAYLQFVMSKQSKLREKHPELGQVDVTRRLAQKWKEIGPERRSKYIQRYEHLKKQYQAEIEEFYSEHPDARPQVQDSPKVRRMKKQEDGTFDSEAEKRYKELKLLAPKPPVTAYFMFVNAKRGRYKDKHPNLKSSEITKKLADKWHSLSTDKQNKYKKVYDDNYKEYKSKMDEFYGRYPDAKELFKRKKGPQGKRKTPATPASLSTLTQSVTASPVPSPQPSGFLVTTATIKNTPQKHKHAKEETEEEEEESSSGSESSGDSDSESDSDENDQGSPSTVTKMTVTTPKSTPASSNIPVARKEIKIAKKEESSESSSNSDSSDSSSDDD